jgi:hypothetical protein
MTKRCHNIQDDLKAFIDKELAWPRALSVRFHLLSCETCRKEVSAMQKVSEELRQTESDVRVLDTGLRDKILSQVQTVAHIDRPGTAGNGMSATRPPRRAPAWAWSGALAGILLFAAMTHQLVTSTLQSANESNSSALDNLTTSSAERSVLSAPPSAAPNAQHRMADQMFKRAMPSMQDQASRTAGSPSGYASGFSTEDHALNSITTQRPATAAGTGYSSSLNTEMSPQRRVHKQASITVQVGDLESNTVAVEQMTKNVGGYIANNNLETGSGGLRRSMLTIKVPVAQFETVLAKIGKLGLIQNKQVSGEDITARVSDAEQSKKVLANQLMQQVERLKKAKEQDKPQQRHEARLLQIQLAQARARYNVLSKLATLSTVQVQLQEKAKPKPVPQSGFMEEINKTKISATEAFMSALRIPIIVLMWVLAYSPLWIPLLIIYRLASRGHLRRSS